MNKIPSAEERLDILLQQKPNAPAEENKDSLKQNIEVLEDWVKLHVTKALNDDNIDNDIDFEERIINSDLVTLVRNLMKRKKWNGKELANHLDVSPDFISNVFSGEKRFNLHLLAKIQRLFDVRLKFSLWETAEYRQL